MKTILLLVALIGCSLAFYEGNTPVTVLTAQNYNQVNKGIWFVYYFASWCGHCRNMAPEWEKAASSLKGIVNLAAIDASGQNINVPGLQGFPTIRFLVDGNEKEYKGGRTARDFVAYALEEVKKIAFQRLNEPGPDEDSHGGDSQSDDDVIVLTDDLFDSKVLDDYEPWFVEFYAPWCGHCKNLAPEWAALATEVKGYIKVAKVDATVHSRVAQSLGVSGYPTIKFFPAGKKTLYSAVDYTGQRSASSMAEWLREQNGDKGYNLQELNSQDVYDTVCKKKICIISFVPHILDSSYEQRERYFETIKEVGKKFRGKPFVFLWAQGGDQYDFETIFGAEGSGYPSVIAISHAKKVFSKMRKSFDEEHLEAFVTDILDGKGRFSSFKQEPNNIKTLEAQKEAGCDEDHCAPPEL